MHRCERSEMRERVRPAVVNHRHDCELYRQRSVYLLYCMDTVRLGIWSGAF